MRGRLVICILLALASSACKPKSAAPEASAAQSEENAAGESAAEVSTADGPTSATDRKPAPVEPAAAERDDGESAAGEPAGECVTDRECRSYLRCEGGACVVPPAVDGRVVEGMPEAKFFMNGELIADFKLELAVEPWERSRGLMYRRKMDPDFGMLFIFDGDEERSFWMKNTYLPLDMVHIDSDGVVVGVVANAEPLTQSPRRTGEPARYVLELVAGKAEAVGIERGASMKLENVPPHLSPK